MKKKLLLLCISIAVNVCVVHTQTTTLFTSPENGNYYRIPALATAFDGTLISVTDLRYNDNKDLGNHRIDLLVRRSSDYGTTWSAAVNLTYSHTTSTTGFGDAALVADCESGDVLIICASGSNTYQTGKLNVSRLVSHDNGISWSAPTDITSNIYDLNSSWKSLFRSEERREGKECIRPCRSRGATGA